MPCHEQLPNKYPVPWEAYDNAAPLPPLLSPECQVSWTPPPGQDWARFALCRASWQVSCTAPSHPGPWRYQVLRTLLHQTASGRLTCSLFRQFRSLSFHPPPAQSSPPPTPPTTTTARDPTPPNPREPRGGVASTVARSQFADTSAAPASTLILLFLDSLHRRRRPSRPPTKGMDF